MNDVLMASIASGICSVIVVGFISEIIRNKRKNLFVAEISSWKELCRTAMEERDLLLRRIESRDCQKVLLMQEKLDGAMEENERLRRLNDTYRKALERKKQNERS